MTHLIALLAGTIFGVGLAVSGMTDTDKVIGFLDLFGNWQPGLGLVMFAALTVTTPLFYIVMKRGKTMLSSPLFLPCNNAIDKRLVIGAALFGIGWGLYGYCPGPAIAALSYLEFDSIAFLIAMAAGMVLANKTA